MTKTEFSEKTFEIFVNHCLMSRGYRLYVPSQVKEKKLAYDALINNIKTYGRIAPIALQYKIVFEYANPKPGQKFKFDLHCHIEPGTNKKCYAQHNILYDKNHSAKYFAGYLVPNFTANKELYVHLNNNTLLSNAYFIRPQHKITDQLYHYYTFDDTTALQHSKDPSEDEIHPFEELLAEMENSEKYAVPTKDFIDDLQSISEYDYAEYPDGRSRNVYPAIAYKLY